MRIQLHDIRNDYFGFRQLTELAAKTEDLLLDELIIDMQSVTWFNADMCAPFGALLYRIGSEVNDIELINLRPEVRTILSKNGFLSNYGRVKIEDTYGTTIEYRRFETKDDRLFAAYISQQLMGKALPQMSPPLWKRFRESIFEIFSNAVIHSRTRLGIFTCGQYFPNRHLLDFSIADLGVGIRRNVKERLGLDLSSDAAIDWAISGSNTTKTGSIPGGLGLKLLREFITMNKGRLQIISDTGIWELAGGKIRRQKYACAFPGTVVNIEINTADSGAYSLGAGMSVSLEDIF